MSSPLIPIDIFPMKGMAKPVQPVVLPRDERLQDHLAEWWYFIALLENDSKTRKLAVEMTAARLSVPPMRAIETCYIAVIDIDAKRYRSADRQSMTAYDYSSPHLKMVFEPPYGQPDDWVIEGFAPADGTSKYQLDGGFRVRPTKKDPWEQYAVRLDFEDKTPRVPLKHGAKLDGVIGFFDFQMGYYSRARLNVKGALKLGTKHELVDGYGWMDHEWGLGDLLSNRWIFIAIQLKSGEELCIYRVDRRDGSEIGKTHGYFVDATDLEYADSASIDVTGTWGKAGYPLWNDISLVFKGRPPYNLKVHPEFEDQRRVPTGEMTLPYVTFWEGAAQVLEADGVTPAGRAFLELAGYE